MADAQHPLADSADSADNNDASDNGVRRLMSEHHALDSQIRHLSTLTYLTEDEQFQENDLKKRKLAVKDRIEAMTRGHRGPAVATVRHTWA
jgi:uncharacterized protein YdcH (DUF465 family)